MVFRKVWKDIFLFYLPAKVTVPILLAYAAVLGAFIGGIYVDNEEARAATGVVFNYTGGSQTYTVPTGVTKIYIKMWGAGGESANLRRSSSTVTPLSGGAGGYAEATLAVTPGQNLSVIVGGTNGGYLGGASGASGSVGAGGDGGGLSGIYTSSFSAVVVAGGGGGGGTVSSSGNLVSGQGGAGGGATGDATYGSAEGTQTAGGDATLCSAADGSLIYGGDASISGCAGGNASNLGAGGGGGGVYGGAGGGISSGTTGWGGGGGSGYCSSSLLTCSTAAGSGTTPGNASDPDRPNNIGGPDQNGVVIIYPYILSISASPQQVQSGDASVVSWSAIGSLLGRSPLPWTYSGADLPTGLNYSQAAVPGDGYVYLFGGTDLYNNSAPTNKIYRASTVTPLSWSYSGAQLPTALSQASLLIPGNGFMYLVGGITSQFGGNARTVFRASLSNPTVWSNLGNALPTPISAYNQAATVGNFMYTFGGLVNGSTSRKIYRAAVSAPTSWSDTGANIPSAIFGATLAMPGDDYIYLFGGNSFGVSSNAIVRAPLSNPTSWSSVGSLPHGVAFAPLSMPGDGYLYLLGGQINLSATTTILRASVSNPLSWSKVGALPGPASNVPVVTVGDNQYLLGGSISSFGEKIFRSASLASCEITGPGLSSIATSGAMSTGPLAATSTYTMSCLTTNGMSATSTTVGVVTPAYPPLPTIAAFDADRTRTASSSVLSFTVNSMAAGITCKITPALQSTLPNWSGGNPWVVEDLLTAPLMTSTIFTLACGNGHATTTRSTTAGLIPTVRER